MKTMSKQLGYSIPPMVEKNGVFQEWPHTTYVFECKGVFESRFEHIPNGNDGKNPFELNLDLHTA